MSKENIQRVDIREDTYLEMLDKVNKYDKQKEVLDKIKEKLHNSKEYKMAIAMELNKEQSILIDIDKLLEEIE